MPLSWSTIYQQVKQDIKQPLMWDIITGLTLADVYVYDFCIGHPEENGTSWPWFAFQSNTDTSELDQKCLELSDKIENHEYRHQSEKKKWEAECDRLYRQALVPNALTRHIVVDLLTQFYQHHRPPFYGAQLVCTNYGFAYGQVANAHADSFYQFDKKEQLAKIEPCRQEFKYFGEFLRQQFEHK